MCVPKYAPPITSRCLNATTSTISDDTNCSVELACGNQFCTQYSVDIIQTRIGLGATCNDWIPMGAFIFEYVGEILFEEEA
ncbi:hypothetical protein JG687_00007784 [Phytophthora cactorum]|uniref:SET domain n=1 Tax=Phytophthora cactorum TaxID=29920 RepID=A0A8T1UE64_9STRA|nr:hypothetical protein GQ600_25203 [Phytophthora cactorum]KAG6961271.1 hypothetical protein JG687_00007784 [Phytophthora cactorum]